MAQIRHSEADVDRKSWEERSSNTKPKNIGIMSNEEQILCEKKGCFEIEESRRISREEAERVQKLKTEPKAQKKDEPSDLVADSRLCKTKGMPWSTRKIKNQRQRAALKCPTFPVNPPDFRVPEGCLAATLDLPHCTRNSMETFLKVYLLKKQFLVHSKELP